MNLKAQQNPREMFLWLDLRSLSVYQLTLFRWQVADLFVGISIAAGQNTTLFLAKPNEKFSDLPRHPEEIDAPAHCVKCNTDNGEDDSPLECDKVWLELLDHRVGADFFFLVTSVIVHGI